MKQLINLQILFMVLAVGPMANALDAKCENLPRAVIIGSSVTMGFFGDSPSVLILKNTKAVVKGRLKRSNEIDPLTGTYIKPKPKIEIDPKTGARSVNVNHVVRLYPGDRAKSDETFNMERGFERGCVTKIDFPIRDTDELFKPFIRALGIKEDVDDVKALFENPTENREAIARLIRNADPKKRPDIIIGLDLFIHDVTFTRYNPDKHGPSLDAYKDGREAKAMQMVNLLEVLSENSTVIIGSVFSSDPEPYPYQRPMAGRLNAQLCQRAQDKSKKFFVLPVTQMYKELYTGGPFKYFAKSDTSSSIVPLTAKVNDVMTDYYHPGPQGAYIFANNIMHSLGKNGVTKRYPFSSELFTESDVKSQPIRNDLIVSLFNLIEEDDKYSLTKVDANTITSEEIVDCDSSTVSTVAPLIDPPNVDDVEEQKTVLSIDSARQPAGTLSSPKLKKNKNLKIKK